MKLVFTYSHFPEPFASKCLDIFEENEVKWLLFTKPVLVCSSYLTPPHNGNLHDTNTQKNVREIITIYQSQVLLPIRVTHCT